MPPKANSFMSVLPGNQHRRAKLGGGGGLRIPYKLVLFHKSPVHADTEHALSSLWLMSSHFYQELREKYCRQLDFSHLQSPKQCTKAGSGVEGMRTAHHRLAMFSRPLIWVSNLLTHRQENDRCKLKEKSSSWQVSWRAGVTQHNVPGSVLFKMILFEPTGLSFCFEKVQSEKEERKSPDRKKIQTFLACE